MKLKACRMPSDCCRSTLKHKYLPADPMCLSRSAKDAEPEKKGRQWYECDTGYKGKKRGPTRLLYSSDGLYYYTDDHYNTFRQMYPEDAR